MERRTPLYETHVREGAKIVPFAGYLLPVQYPTGIRAEHEAVRTACGLFDVSHMGEVLITGPGALASLNHLATNDYTTLKAGHARYGVLCNDRGGCIDDLIVYKLGDECYLAVVNASNREKDFAHMSANLLPDTEAVDISDAIAQLALQGPGSQRVMERLVPKERLPLRYYGFVERVGVAGVDCLVSRTGYTGEDGFELYTVAERGQELWAALRRAGEGEGLVPCGLGARDTLRLEAGMPLYGHEMDEGVSPLESGLDHVVRLDKDEFIGREALIAQRPRRMRIGLEATGRGILRERQDVYLGDALVGRTTSGTRTPHLGRAVAMALVERDLAGDEEATLEVDVRGRRVAARRVPLPFYRRA